MPYINCTLTFLNDHEAEYTDDLKYFPPKQVTGNVGGDELGLRTVRKLNEWVQKHSEYCFRGELSLLGFHLYRIAFDTQPDPPLSLADRPLKDAFESTYKTFLTTLERDGQMRMRLKLVFKREAEKLAGLPWEFLCVPHGDDGIFAAQQTELILTRFVPEEAWGRVLQPDRGDQKLRILIVTVEPRELGQVSGERVIAEILKLKSEHIDVQLFTERPTLARLREVISGSDEESGFRPHILHFMGHGRAGELALLKEEQEFKLEVADAERRMADGGPLQRVDEAQWVNIETVKSLFIRHKPRVVFLHACEGAASDSLTAFSNTARELAYTHIPAVIAMQYEIGNSEAELFAKTFYRQLRRGKEVDEAVTEARRQLGLTILKVGRNVWDERSFGTPVIYLQTERPVILPPPPKSATVDESDLPRETAPPRKVPCPNGKCDANVIFGRPSCVYCGKALMICPSCRQMMMTEFKLCDCGYRLDSATSSQQSAAKPEAFEPSPEQKNAPRHQPVVQSQSVFTRSKGLFGAPHDL